ncbi:MAG: RNA polymerase sigma factor [Candidatus Magasanikbacteria bacterium]|nr:RNA polymerase sigma factor [Candidatus Magasanikbacteria bacterium]
MSSQLRDKYLIYRIQTKRDAEAYAELYDTYVAGIYRFISFKVSSKEEAQDLTSEAFLRAWHYLLESRDVVSFSSLIYRISRNLVIDHYRSRRNYVSLDERLETDDEEALSPTDGGGQIQLIDTTIEANAVIDAMKHMKEEYRDILMLRYIEELSTGEIAEIIGKSHVSVRVLLHRATTTLKTILEKHETS